MTARINWSPDELLLAFRLYCRTPFGRLHSRNPEIVDLAKMLNRTPSAVAMKACNFASLDPTQAERKIKALANVSRADRHLWDEFQLHPEDVAARAEAAFTKLTGRDEPPLVAEIGMPEGPTETVRLVRARRVQAFFREAVLAGYGYRCAISNISLRDLLNASHIIPWKADTDRRADPRNGIALNVLHDRAFDRGLITFDDSFRLVLSRRIRNVEAPSLYSKAFLRLEGQKLRLPERFAPDPVAMEYHRNHIFAEN